MTLQLPAPAIGFRGFNWTDGGPLRSVGVQAEWTIQREPQIARCHRTMMWAFDDFSDCPPEHESPAERCTCGLYAHSKPEDIPVSVDGIKGLTIGYGKLVIHPDGWRAQKSEIIALLAPPVPKPLPPGAPQCDHAVWDLATLACVECGWTITGLKNIGVTPPMFLNGAGGISLNRSATITNGTFSSFRPIGGTIRFAPSSHSPSLAALEILAEQYGARVVESWDDAVALAEEQGATRIPDAAYLEAKDNAPAPAGEFWSGGWTVVRGWAENNTFAVPEKSFAVPSSSWHVSMSSYSAWPSKVKSRGVRDVIKLKREKRELHAQHWKPKPKAA